jgi:hypothetical protein
MMEQNILDTEDELKKKIFDSEIKKFGDMCTVSPVSNGQKNIDNGDIVKYLFKRIINHNNDVKEINKYNDYYHKNNNKKND